MDRCVPNRRGQLLWVALLVSGCCQTAAAGEPRLPAPPLWNSATDAIDPTLEEPLIIRFQEGRELTPQQPLDRSLDPSQPMDPGRLGAAGPSLELLMTAQAMPPSGDRVSRSQTETLASTELGQTLQNSTAVQTTAMRQRTGSSLDPIVRGYGMGQIYTSVNGVNWVSARPDLDTLLNKTDASTFEALTITPGPYGLRYGPGFAFIDVVTSETPRYADCPEAHNRMGWTFRNNGGQIYGTDRFYGGGADYGYAISYGKRTGSDYLAGNGLRIPSGYENQDLSGQFGFDLAEDSRLELRYQYADHNRNESPAQFFDVNSLLTHGWSLSWQKGQITDAARLEATGWYNRTTYSGDTLGAGKRRTDFPVLSRVDQALADVGYASWSGTMHGDSVSAGARSALVLGSEDDLQLRTGVDCRVLQQAIYEDYRLGADPLFETNLPKGQLIDPGLYSELTLAATSYWTTALGGRLDWARTTADSSAQRLPSALGLDLEQSNLLAAFYLKNKLYVSPNWTTELAVGHSEITPDLFQRYSDGVFLGIIQSGFSRVIGQPDLLKERLWQVDWSLDANFETFRGRASFFYAWVNDYVTYSANVIEDPLGARLLVAKNTNLAILSGFSLQGEYDLGERLSTFGAVRYVQGEDCQIAEPLAQIAPLEGTVGFRLHDQSAKRPWGFELGVRMVDGQDRNAFLQGRTPNGVGVVPLEEQTAGFTTVYLRGRLQPTRNLSVVGGVDNLFNRNYIEHLNLRLPATSSFLGAPVLSPGVTPYLGVEWTL